MNVQLEAISEMTRDLRKAADTLTVDEARFLVDHYYAMQGQRIRAANQCRALTTTDEPHRVMEWFLSSSKLLEDEVRKALHYFAKSKLEGIWALSICGIGPIIASGLIAHIDPEKALTAGKVWRYAGMDPTSKWEKGRRRPWNASLKVLCYKIGDSFIKVQSRESDVYGKLFRERKDKEIEMNLNGEFANQAKEILRTKKIGKTTSTYGHLIKGRLSPDHINSRARRYAAKIFIAHYQQVIHFIHHGTIAPRPWIIEHGGHVDEIIPPNMHLIPNMEEFWRARCH